MNKTTGDAVPAESGEDRRQVSLERRETDRRPFVAAVRHEPASGRMHLGQAANLGLSGMQVRRRVHTAEPALAARAPVAVAFALPDGGELLRLQAEVVFDEPQGGAQYVTGLRFADPSAEVKARLRSFLTGATSAG